MKFERYKNENKTKAKYIMNTARYTIADIQFYSHSGAAKQIKR